MNEQTQKLVPFALAVAEAALAREDAKSDSRAVANRKGVEYSEWREIRRRYIAAKARFRHACAVYRAALSETRRGYNPTIDENAKAILEWIKSRGLGI